MERAITETVRRRGIQMKYNEEHGIIPKTIIKDVRDILDITMKTEDMDAKVKSGKKMTANERRRLIDEMTKQMQAAAKMLEFEHAAYLRDKIKELRGE